MGERGQNGQQWAKSGEQWLKVYCMTGIYFFIGILLFIFNWHIPTDAWLFSQPKPTRADLSTKMGSDHENYKVNGCRHKYPPSRLPPPPRWCEIRSKGCYALWRVVVLPPEWISATSTEIYCWCLATRSFFWILFLKLHFISVNIISHFTFATCNQLGFWCGKGASSSSCAETDHIRKRQNKQT